MVSVVIWQPNIKARSPSRDILILVSNQEPLGLMVKITDLDLYGLS